MPRFYFPSWDGDSFVPDQQGLDVDSVEQACVLARTGLAEMARDVLAGSGSARVMRIQVLDEARRVVSEIRLAFEIESGG
jgi:hypothetical protein